MMNEPLGLGFFQDYLLPPDPAKKTATPKTWDITISKGGRLFPITKDEEVTLCFTPLICSTHSLT